MSAYQSPLRPVTKTAIKREAERVFGMKCAVNVERDGHGWAVTLVLFEQRGKVRCSSVSMEINGLQKEATMQDALEVLRGLDRRNSVVTPEQAAAGGPARECEARFAV
jgi:hypothetical protein